MLRRDVLKFLGYLGIRACEPCTAELGYWCIWSSYQRNIGNRLTNNHDYIFKDDLYINLEAKKIIEDEYERQKKKGNAIKNGRIVLYRRADNSHIIVDIVNFN